jgi:hypothetical protein
MLKKSIYICPFKLNQIVSCNWIITISCLQQKSNGIYRKGGQSTHIAKVHNVWSLVMKYSSKFQF